MQTTYELSKLEEQSNAGTISPDGDAWLDGYNAGRTHAVHSDAYMSGGAEAGGILTAPDHYPADLVTYWNAGAQQAYDDFTGEG